MSSQSSKISVDQRSLSHVSVLKDLQARWLAHWPAALAAWSRFTKLSEPRWCFTDADAAREGLTESFAMIRLVDHVVVINLALVRQNGLDGFGLEILAHEIGHHVYCPADLNDNARMIARTRWGLPTKETFAPMVSNLYADLLINDRLQRSERLRLAEVYRALGAGPEGDRMWALYMRIYEILWSLTRGTLTPVLQDDRLEGDAQLGARLIRVYARDWLDGAGKFAALCLPYLLEQPQEKQLLRGWRDMAQAGQGGLPQGLTEIEAGERDGAIHPMYDPLISGLEEDEAGAQTQGQKIADSLRGHGAPGGQHREPFEYGEVLRSLGLELDQQEIAVRYYKERAAPHLIRFPERKLPESTDPLPEGLETWDIGSPLEDADWMQSVITNPRIIPGVTTVQRTWGVTEGSRPQKEPLDLDLYVDCSGSMPNPQSATSFLTLAGAIIALSALRAGARVQATLWSGARQFITTDGFVRDETRILQILTGYLGGATAFPIHILRDTFQSRKPADRPAHILVISDDGVTTMFDKDEQGHSGWDIAAMALKNARGGGTLVLNLYWELERVPDLVKARAMGWRISVVRTWDELVTFAREFSQVTYGEQ
jgi:hypothetical protein